MLGCLLNQGELGFAVLLRKPGRAAATGIGVIRMIFIGARSSRVRRRLWRRGGRAVSFSRALVGIATVAAFLVIPGVALADTYTPTRFDDPSPDGCKKGDCSLREAVIAANAHSGTDVIVLRGGATYSLSRKNPAG